MEENNRPENDQSQQAQEALNKAADIQDKAATIERLLQVRAAYYANRTREMEEQRDDPEATEQTNTADQLQEAVKETAELREKTNQTWQRMMLMRKNMDRAA